VLEVGLQLNLTIARVADFTPPPWPFAALKSITDTYQSSVN
jgi:hypothetical protein